MLLNDVPCSGFMIYFASCLGSSSMRLKQCLLQGWGAWGAEAPPLQNFIMLGQNRTPF